MIAFIRDPRTKRVTLANAGKEAVPGQAHAIRAASYVKVLVGIILQIVERIGDCDRAATLRSSQSRRRAKLPPEIRYEAVLLLLGIVSMRVST